MRKYSTFFKNKMVCLVMEMAMTSNCCFSYCRPIVFELTWRENETQSKSMYAVVASTPVILCCLLFRGLNKLNLIEINNFLDFNLLNTIVHNNNHIDASLLLFNWNWFVKRSWPTDSGAIPILSDQSFIQFNQLHVPLNKQIEHLLQINYW